ncbi:MAG: CotH kinase family protein [Lachnospiraceae bacterium]|nr:CotH kinase family protein [Lachnospiraceae bacterium]
MRRKYYRVLLLAAVSLLLLGVSVRSEKQAVQMALSDDVISSLDSSFCEGDLVLDFTCTGEYPVYYTLDGSIPTLDSNFYEGPLTLACSDEVQSVVVRACTYDENAGVWGDLFTRTYFYARDMETIHKRFDTYIVCVTSDPYNLYDHEYGIMTEGKIREEYMNSPNYDPKFLLQPANYTQRGIEWERDAHLEILTADGEHVIDQDVGLRIFGNASRQSYRKSMKFYAREEYGDDTFSYPLFPENRSVKSGEVQPEYRRLIIRNHANDRSVTLFREELFQRLCSQIEGIDSKCVAPAAVYLNGEYYNFEWLQEVYDDLYMEDNYGVSGSEYYETATVWLHEGEVSTEKELRAQAAYEELQEYAKQDMTDDRVFAEFSKIMDIDNMLQHYAVQCYIANWDWAHNRKLYRYTDSVLSGETDRQDGRWRFLYYDMEVGFNIYNEPEEEWTTIVSMLEEDELLEAVLQRDDMQKKFVNYLGLCMNEYFTMERVRSVITELQNERDHELLENIIYKSAREEGYTLTMESIASNIDIIYEFVEKRPDIIRKEVKELFGISM